MYENVLSHLDLRVASDIMTKNVLNILNGMSRSITKLSSKFEAMNQLDGFGESDNKMCTQCTSILQACESGIGAVYRHESNNYQVGK